MSNVVVTESHLTFGGVAYFRAHAEEVEIGSIGEKRTPLVKQNYLEVKDRVQFLEKNIVTATVADIDFTKTSKKAFKAKAKAIVEGIPMEVEGNAVFNNLRSGELKLVKFSISNNNMKRAINNSPPQLQDLIHWGNDARVVLQIFIVIEAALANTFSRNIDVGLSAGFDGLEAELGIDISTAGSTKVNLSKGTCFAYLLAKIEWDAKKKKNRTKILDLDDDQWGLA